MSGGKRTESAGGRESVQYSAMSGVHGTAYTVHRAEGLWRCTRSAAVVMMNCTNHIAEALACCESRLCWLEPPDGRRVL
jgi:hypothetical protein